MSGYGIKSNFVTTNRGNPVIVAVKVTVCDSSDSIGLHLPVRRVGMDLGQILSNNRGALVTRKTVRPSVGLNLAEPTTLRDVQGTDHVDH